MFKKILTLIFGVSVLMFSFNAAYSQQTKEEILNVFSPTLVSPLSFYVKTGNTINLKIVNQSDNAVKFMIPMMKISVEVDKLANTIVPINFSLPNSKEVWFILEQNGASNKTGSFIVTDYVSSANTIADNLNNIDTSFLNQIINFNKDYKYEDKPEPVYSAPVNSAEVPIYSEDKAKPAIEAVEKKETNLTPDPVTKKEIKHTTKGKYVRGYW